MAKDYYKILGVEKTATEEDIKKAYRKLAHEHHPDKKGGDAERFKAINEAYQILSNKEKRHQYDQFGRVFDGMPGGGGAGNPFGAGFGFEFDPSMFDSMTGDPGELFDMFFEGLGIRRKRRTYEHGADLEATITITLEEAFSGTVKEMAISHFTACAECAGHGHEPSAGVTPCKACDGHGEIRETRKGFFGASMHVKPCTACHGLGHIPNKICPACAGEGRIRVKNMVTIKVMPGIENGQIIKVSGAGDQGPRRAGAGDLYAHVKVATHAAFNRAGADLVTKKEIPLIDLLLNKKIEIMSLGGERYAFEAPQGISAAEPVRIPGGGMPRLGSRARGDLYVELIIKRPKKISSRAKQILEDLKRELE